MPADSRYTEHMDFQIILYAQSGVYFRRDFYTQNLFLIKEIQTQFLSVQAETAFLYTLLARFKYLRIVQTS